METHQQEHEDFADLIQWIMDDTGDGGSAIARRIGVSPSTVSNWLSRKRGTGRGPSTNNVRALCAAYGIPEDRAFTAAQRKVPGPLAPGDEERLLRLFAELTREQQELYEIQLRATVEHNRSAPE